MTLIDPFYYQRIGVKKDLAKAQQGYQKANVIKVQQQNSKASLQR